MYIQSTYLFQVINLIFGYKHLKWADKKKGKGQKLSSGSNLTSNNQQILTGHPVDYFLNDFKL